MTEPNWQPMDAIPHGVTVAWLYGHFGVELAKLHEKYWYSAIYGHPVYGPVRWTAFLKPPPPKDIRL